jgi:hypothetical protein
VHSKSLSKVFSSSLGWRRFGQIGKVEWQS